MTVDIPAGASGGESDSLSVSLTSQGDGGKTAGAALTTSANPRYALQLTPASAAQSGEAGTSVAYALQVTNQGNTADSFDITLGGNLWPASAPASLGPLAPGASAVLTVTVDIPAEASGGDSDSLSVNLASQGDGGQTASAALTTTANPRYALQLTPASAAQSGETGTNVTYALQVTNQGNASDSFSVSLAGSAWSSSAPSNLGPLAAGASQTLTVTVTIPANASAGETDALQVSLASQGDGAQTAQALLTTTANPRFGLALLAHTAAQSAAPGETLSYTLTITNTGNGSDTFTISLGGQTWAGSAPGSLTLAAGQSASFQVQVTIPSSAANGESDTLNVTVSSQGDPSQSGSAVLVSTALRAGTRLALPVIFK